MAKATRTKVHRLFEVKAVKVGRTKIQTVVRREKPLPPFSKGKFVCGARCGEPMMLAAGQTARSHGGACRKRVRKALIRQRKLA